MTALQIAARFLGMREVDGPRSNPIILGMLQYAGQWPNDDSVPWCSAFVWSIAWLLDLPRPSSNALAARSWLTVGRLITLDEAEPKNDIVILERGAGGHVGFYHGHTEQTIAILGGNQSNAVNITAYERSRLLGVRRLG